MGLYEVTTSRYGESYVRAYVWARDEEEALRLYAEKNEWPPRRVRLLLTQASAPFSTSCSDSGWEH